MGAKFRIVTALSRLAILVWLMARCETGVSRDRASGAQEPSQCLETPEPVGENGHIDSS
jgi:hypothetical protein